MSTQRKVIITCAVTGAIHTPSMSKALPVTPQEIADAAVDAAEAGAAIVHLHERGYAGQKVRINVKEGGKALASQEVTLKAEGVDQVEQVLFNVGDAGVKTVETAIEPLANEENPRNNRVTRLVNV